MELVLFRKYVLEQNIHDMENLIQLEGRLGVTMLQRWLEPYFMSQCDRLTSLNALNSYLETDALSAVTRDWI